jgi:hypothetical protein
MAAFLERLGLFLRAPDPRPLREIEREIEEELAFHVEASTQALAEEGLERDAARAEALRRFGDVDRVRRECARTQMGERIVLQRIQFVLTAGLLVAVGFLVFSNRESTAQAAQERARSLALMEELEARLASGAGLAARPEAPGDLAAAGTLDGRLVYSSSEAVQPGEHLAADGRSMALLDAARTWSRAFDEQRSAWRHGLGLAQRLAALPGSQGPEILAQIWARLSVEHREQIMKPFVFGGGHPHALEVLELGFDDEASSVKERAVLYLHTYAWQDLWRGEGTGQRWFAEWRDQPVAEVLRANASRWARAYGEVFLGYDQPFAEHLATHLASVDSVRIETFTAAGVDLGAILREAGACGIEAPRLSQLSAEQRQVVARIESWCAEPGK